MDSNVGRQDKELKNILDDLNDEKAPQAFNRSNLPS